jgi:hypothetical protein
MQKQYIAFAYSLGLAIRIEIPAPAFSIYTDIPHGGEKRRLVAYNTFLKLGSIF